MSLESKIAEFAEEHGIIIGICGGGPIIEDVGAYGDGSHLSDACICEGGPIVSVAGRFAAKTPFVKYSAARRNDPRLTMPGCKSVIVIGAGHKKKFAFTDDGLPRGVLSQCAIGTDYHIKLKKILLRLKESLSGYADFNCRIFVDTGPLSEKDLLVKAGLGRRGRNGLVFSEKFGSFFNAGYMLTDLELEPYAESDKPACGGGQNDTACASCRLCETSCPGGALKNGVLDHTRCISYLTQKSGAFNERELKLVGANLYGCDICREACPRNAGVPAEEIDDIEAARPELTRFIALSEEEFNGKYADAAFRWRGSTIMKRNAEAALYNIKQQADGS